MYFSYIFDLPIMILTCLRSWRINHPLVCWAVQPEYPPHLRRILPANGPALPIQASTAHVLTAALVLTHLDGINTARERVERLLQLRHLRLVSVVLSRQVSQVIRNYMGLRVR